MDEKQFVCTMSNCRYPRKDEAWCRGCGFEKHEAARRRRIELTQWPDGKRRKFVGKISAADCIATERKE